MTIPIQGAGMKRMQRLVASVLAVVAAPAFLQCVNAPLEIPPAAPQLIAPANESRLLDTAMDFRWQPAAGAEFYRIDMMVSSPSGLIPYDSLTTIDPGWTLPEGGIRIACESLHWQVTAVNEFGESVPSSRWILDGHVGH